MASSTFDPNQFKTDQRQGWNSVAQGWKEWWQPIERGAQKLSRRLVELAEIKPGQRVLDIATGIGEPAMTAANVVGASGRVLATDISGQMLAVAKQRSKSLGLEDIIEFRESDAENLDLLNSSFDAALCRWGLMLLPNFDSVLHNIHTWLLPGGRFAAAVWADPHKVPIISLATKIIIEELGILAPQNGTPNPFSLADTNTLENSFLRAGLTDVHTETLTVTFEFASGEDYSRYCQAVSASARIVLSKETENRKREIWKKVAEAASKYGTGDNSIIRMNNESICIKGIKP
jgi:ubiquinone/menaquinone biosynthesis C-methylase UbiE